MPTLFPTAIFQLRHEARPVLRQEDVAFLVGIAQSKVSAYEKGQVGESMTLLRAMQIAAALGASVEDTFPSLWEHAKAHVAQRRS